MRKSSLIIIFLFIAFMFLIPPKQQVENIEIESLPLRQCGDGSTPEDPLNITVDQYYGNSWVHNWSTYFETYSVRYLQIHLVENEIYFLYLKDAYLYWDIELYNDSLYTELLGVPYAVTGCSIWRRYMTFSPNRTGYYYLIFYKDGLQTNPSFIVLQAKPYIINTSKVVLISPPTIPVRVFHIDLLEGNYTCNQEVLYAVKERGWNYVVMSDDYGFFPKNNLFNMPACTLTLIFEDACEFELTYYLPVNEDPPDNETSPDNSTDNPTNPDGFGGLLSGMTPIFGVGLMVGILAICLMKKKK